MRFTRRNIHRQVTAAVRTTFLIVTFLCLCVSLWQAPLPVLHHHVHADYATLSKTMVSQTMDRHQSAWHGDDETKEAGWHLHVAMLDDILRGGGCPVPSEPDSDELPLTIEHAVPTNQLTGQLDPLLTPLQPLVASQDDSHKTFDLGHALRSRRQFLGDQAEARRLLTVLCVIRC